MYFGNSDLLISLGQMETALNPKLGTTLNQFGSNGPPGYTSLGFVENVSYVLSFMIFSPGTAVGFCFSSDHDLCMPCVDKCMQDGSLNMEQCSFKCHCHWYGK